MPPRGYSHKKPSQNELLDAFERRFIPEPMSGCWLWTGNYFSKRGSYGCFTMRPAGIFMMRAHRLSWILYRGPIDPTLHVLHRCDNPGCVNPDHLFLGNQSSNMRDKVAKDRQDKGEKHGHAKLSAADVFAIRSNNKPQKIAAALYGVSVVTISDIRRRRSWAHL